MIKYLYFILGNGTEHIFPLESLLYIRSSLLNDKYEISIGYKISSEHGYEIIALLNTTEKDQFISNLMAGIQRLQTETDTHLLTFNFHLGEPHERISIH